jgi:inner membrane protein
VASAFTHAIAGLAIGTAFRRPGPPARFWVLGAIGAVIPDLDGIGYWLGVPYDSLFGHRGITHSLMFAALFASAGMLAFRDDAYRDQRTRIWAYLFLATASHGVLDAMTSGGGGVAFFAPFVNRRYFFPWRPILVSPMSISRFFTERGIGILASEAVWVWVPAALFALLMSLIARRAPATPGSRRVTGT